MTTEFNRLEGNIDNVLELSSVCRGEWCRSLESEVDLLENEVIEGGLHATTAEGARFAALEKKLRRAYKYLGPDIHI